MCVCVSNDLSVSQYLSHSSLLGQAPDGFYAQNECHHHHFWLGWGRKGFAFVQPIRLLVSVCLFSIGMYLSYVCPLVRLSSCWSGSSVRW